MELVPDLRQFYKDCEVDAPPDVLTATRWYVGLFPDGAMLDSNCLYGNGWMLGYAAIHVKEALAKLCAEGLLVKKGKKVWQVRKGS